MLLSGFPKENVPALLEAEKKYWCIIIDSAWFYSQKNILVEQKKQPNTNMFKRFDFTAAPFWIMIGNGRAPIAIHDAAGLAAWLGLT
jgi:hypothetical protein